jgi:hypothetical protein
VLPELISTPTPTPTPNVWKPGETFENAKKTVTYAYQGIVDFLIWVFVVFVPIFAPPALIIWALWKFFTRKPKKKLTTMIRQKNTRTPSLTGDYGGVWRKCRCRSGDASKRKTVSLNAAFFLHPIIHPFSCILFATDPSIDRIHEYH